MDPNSLLLRDLHLPPPVDWWPPAPGWWLLLALALFGLGWLIRRAWLKRQFLAPSRHAVRALASIEAEYLTHQDPVILARQASELLRRAMLAYAPRHEVAGLTGEAWLAWLDRDLPVPYFHTEGGRSLLQLPYSKPGGDYRDVDINALLSAIRMRLATPIGGVR
jgi:Domain of unknown function (DUF4381)